MVHATRTASITVQNEPVTGYQEAPLPSENQYWRKKVEGENRNWNVLTGPWLQSGYNATGAFNPYTTAPGSAHILWTENFGPNGIIGGDYGSLQMARDTLDSQPR